jgi:hypothetical protein
MRGYGGVGGKTIRRSMRKSNVESSSRVKNLVQAHIVTVTALQT